MSNNHPGLVPAIDPTTSTTKVPNLAPSGLGGILSTKRNRRNRGGKRKTHKKAHRKSHKKAHKKAHKKTYKKSRRN